MTKKKEKKTERRFVMETLTAGTIRKRMRVVVPKDLKEPKTPEPTKATKKEKRE